MSRLQINRFVKTHVKLVGAIVPIVLCMILLFFLLTGSEILALSKDKLALESKNYAEDISAWLGQTLDELNIYKDMVERTGLVDDEVYEALKTSYGSHEAYPYGLYLGDETGRYFFASGWEPGDDYVISQRDWYIEGLQHEEFAFGEPYTDAMTGKICLSASARLSCGPAVTVLSADVYLDYAEELVEEITEGNIENAFFVAGSGKMILVNSDDTQAGKFLGGEDNPVLYQNINRLLEKNKTGQHEVEGKGGIYYVDINQIEDTDWYFVTCMTRQTVLSELHRVEAVMFLVAALASVTLFFVTKRIARDMSEIRTKAKTDPLTRLLNRDGFKEMMMLALETHPDQGVLLILDMDNFKQINDQLGHPTGDAVLKQFADMLEGYFNRNKDIVARLGGDEFVVFVGREIKDAEVEEMLRKFKILVHETFDGAYPQQRLSVSIGAAFVTDGIVYDTLYASADKALYEVKQRGKDGYLVWESGS